MDNKKPETSKSGPSGRNSTGHLKKSKRRNAKKSSSLGHRSDERQTEQNGAEGPSMEYANVFWQQPGMQQHIPLHNGQRLFTAMSDPSVCGYSPMPVTYAMEPVSLPPMYRLYQPVPRPGYRTLRGRPRRNYPQTHPIGSQTNANAISNGYSSLQENRLNYSAPAAYQNGDYASLPPSANNDNGTAGDELNSEQRRYSDPGLGPAELPPHCQSEDSESIDSGSSITTVGKNSKLVLSLIEQMTALKENNSQLFKELQETKSDLEDVKAELARYKHATSLDYQPGMLSDIVREIREANKVREETLIRKVKSMMEDKPVAPRSMEFDELKSQLGKIEEESNKRLVKLEDQITSLKINANNESREIAVFEEENLALRRELQEARASRTLAENQAAKCVSAVARPVTPVTFDTPCITSTPVTVSSSSSRSGVGRPPKQIDQILTSSASSINRDNVQGQLAESHKESFGVLGAFEVRSTLCINSLPVASSSVLNSKASRKTVSSYSDDPDINSESVVQRGDSGKSTVGSEATETPREDRTLGAASCTEEKGTRNPGSSPDGGSVDKPDVSKQHGTEEVKKTLPNGRETKQTKRAVAGSSKKRKKTDNRGTKGVGVVEKNGRDETRDANGIVRNSKSHGSLERLIKLPGGHQSDGISLLTKSALEPDKACSNPDDESIIFIETPEDAAEAAENDETVYDQSVLMGHPDLNEIPDVSVIGGTSIVPKKLCSMKILTSRVLTAPSRATYTTAYI